MQVAKVGKVGKDESRKVGASGGTISGKPILTSKSNVPSFTILDPESPNSPLSIQKPKIKRNNEITKFSLQEQKINENYVEPRKYDSEEDLNILFVLISTWSLNVAEDRKMGEPKWSCTIL